MGLLSGLPGAASETDVVCFSAETQGHFDVESELKLWLSGSDTPVTKEFRGDGSILDIQRTLAAYVCR